MAATDPSGWTRRRALAALAGGACALWPAQDRAETAAPSLAVVTHPSVAAARLSAADLTAIFGGTMRTWKDGSPIKVFNLPVNSPIRTAFDQVVLAMSQEQVSRYWLDKRIRGEGTPPRQIPTPELLVRLVAALPGSISYVPEERLQPNVKVVARVRKGEVIGP